jgi:hypothetical protein
LSQRTRAHTTGGAPRTPPKAKATKNAASQHTTPATDTAEQRDTEARLPLAAETLARTLRAVADELERDPALARRIAGAVRETPTDGPSPAEAAEEPATPPKRPTRAFKPKLITGAGPELGTGIPDPFALYTTLGEAGLRAALDELRLGTLRAMVREHGLDPSGRASKQNDAEKLREVILRAVAVAKR